MCMLPTHLLFAVSLVWIASSVCGHQMPGSLIYVCLSRALKLLIVFMRRVVHVIKCGELGRAYTKAIRPCLLRILEFSLVKSVMDPHFRFTRG